MNYATTMIACSKAINFSDSASLRRELIGTTGRLYGMPISTWAVAEDLQTRVNRHAKY